MGKSRHRDKAMELKPAGLNEWRGERNDSARANVSPKSNPATQEKRMRLVAISAAVCLVSLGPALGQSGNNTGKPDQASPAQGANQNDNANQAAGDASAFPDRVKNGLQQAGFTDVQVVPRSFLVRAKDKNGQPVTMLINGNMILQINGLPGEGAATTGSGANSDSNAGSAPGTNTGGASTENPDSNK